MTNKRQVWTLYRTATGTGSRPSELIGVADRWAALQFDQAVMFVGTVIEGAVQEMVKVGTEDAPRWEPKYTMAQLLDDSFRLPTAGGRPVNDVSQLKNMHGMNFDEVD